jgi:hypothetical protein
VLYDLMGFPHGPYTFFYIAGLAVAGLGARQQPEPEPPPEPRRPRLALAGLSQATLPPLPPSQQETVPAR